jgi:hypothetical protein
MEEPLEEVQLRSTYVQFKDFLESNIWFDMSAQIRDWLTTIRNQLEVCESDELGILQGGARRCRDFLNLPQSIVDAFEESFEMKKHLD